MRALAVALLALLLAAPALASEVRPTLAELESETRCPVCEGPLELSNAPVANRMRVFIRERIAAGDTKSEIKDRLVAEFGPRVVQLAPEASGFNLLAWLLPFAGLGAGAVAAAVLAWRWSRTREPAVPAPVVGSRNGRGTLEPELERRLDEALARFDP